MHKHNGNLTEYARHTRKGKGLRRQANKQNRKAVRSHLHKGNHDAIRSI